MIHITNSILPTNLLDEDFSSYIGMSIDNVSDEFILCATPLTRASNVATYGCIGIKEY